MRTDKRKLLRAERLRAIEKWEESKKDDAAASVLSQTLTSLSRRFSSAKGKGPRLPHLPKRNNKNFPSIHSYVDVYIDEILQRRKEYAPWNVLGRECGIEGAVLARHIRNEHDVYASYGEDARYLLDNDVVRLKLEDSAEEIKEMLLEGATLRDVSVSVGIPSTVIRRAVEDGEI